MTSLRRTPSNAPGRILPSRRRVGFTLIEVVVVLTMLVLVLTAAYSILNNVMKTERYVERMTLPEKVGEAILTQMRGDFSSCFYRGLTEQLHREVFMGENEESADGHSDRVRFLTTAEPTNLIGATSYDQEIEDLRTVTVVSYFLEQNPNVEGYTAYRLYRKEVSDFSGGNVLDAPGLNIEIYDKVRSFNVEYYDGYEWDVVWDSVQRIQEQEIMIQEAETAGASLQNRLARVTEEAEAAAAAEEMGETVLPPAAIPTAVRIEVQVYGGIGNEVFEENDEPVLRTFRTIVPLFASLRLPIQIDEAELAEGAGGALGGDPNDPSFNTRGDGTNRIGGDPGASLDRLRGGGPGRPGGGGNRPGGGGNRPGGGGGNRPGGGGNRPGGGGGGGPR